MKNQSVIDHTRPYVIYFNQRKNVKNLGWLLRKAYSGQFINLIRVRESIQPCSWEAALTVYFSDNYIFTARFASLGVLREFLHRPVFYGVCIDWMCAPYFMEKVNPLPKIE